MPGPSWWGGLPQAQGVAGDGQRQRSDCGDVAAVDCGCPPPAGLNGILTVLLPRPGGPAAGQLQATTVALHITHA